MLARVMLGRGRAIVQPASLDGPAHPPAAPEPPASASAGLLGSTTVAMPRREWWQAVEQT